MHRLPAILLSVALSTAAFSQTPRPPAPGAAPGAVTFVEGQASLDGRALRASNASSATLKNGEYVATANGKVEIVLTPGVFLRLGEDSTIQVVSADATHTEIRLEQGRADVEAFQLPNENNILIDMKNGQTHLLERGLYAFSDTASTVRVFDGKAATYPGADLTTDVKPIEIKGGHELSLTTAPFKPHGFDKDKSQDALYRWGDMRSGYLAQHAYAGEPYPNTYWAGEYAAPGYGFYEPYGFYPYPYYGAGFFYGGGWGYRSGWGRGWARR